MDFTAIIHSEVKPRSAAEFYLKGIDALLNNQYELALQHFKDCVALDSDLTDAYFRIGTLYLQLNKQTNAIRVLSDLLLRVNIPMVLRQKTERLLVQIYIATEKYHQALALLSRCIKHNPKDPEFRQSEMKAYMGMKSWTEALQSAQIAAKYSKNPYHLEVAQIRTELAKEQAEKTPKAALKQIRDVIKNHPDYAPAYLLCEELLRAQGLKSELLETWKLFFTNLPAEALVYSSKMEQTFFEENAYPEVIALYQELSRSQSPMRKEYLLLLAKQYQKLGNNEQARECRTQVLDLDNPESYVFNLMKTCPQFLDDPNALAELRKFSQSLDTPKQEKTNAVTPILYS
jgi:lipopolysaccharide biosynthesis regulator YciM